MISITEENKEKKLVPIMLWTIYSNNESKYNSDKVFYVEYNDILKFNYF